MSEAVRSTEGFAERSVVERRYEIPLGAKIGQGEHSSEQKGISDVRTGTDLTP